MFITLNLPDGTPVYVNPDEVTYFVPKPNQSLGTILYFSNGTNLTVAQTPPEVYALTPGGP